MKKNTIILLPFLLMAMSCLGQKKLPDNMEDSMCKHGKKYDEPQRRVIDFPANAVSDSFKLKEIHRAIPYILKNDTTGKRWYYTYFYETDILDYNPKNDSIFEPEGDKVLYKLKDTYFFDINGDGLLDFIHYPTYYMAIMNKDFDTYVIFLQTKTGDYQWVTFNGFIKDIQFNKNGSLSKMTTYKGACCKNNQCTFYHYTFNKKANNLRLVKTEQLFTCQLKKK